MAKWPEDLDADRDERFLTISEDMFQERYKIQFIDIDISKIFITKNKLQNGNQNQNQIEKISIEKLNNPKKS